MTDEVTDLPAGHPPIVFDRDSGIDLTTYRDVEEMLRSRSFGMEGAIRTHSSSWVKPSLRWTDAHT